MIAHYYCLVWRNNLNKNKNYSKSPKVSLTYILKIFPYKTQYMQALMANITAIVIENGLSNTEFKFSIKLFSFHFMLLGYVSIFYLPIVNSRVH